MEKKKAEKQKRNLKQEKEKEKKESERQIKNIRENRTCIIRYIEFVYSVYTDTTISQDL